MSCRSSAMSQGPFYRRFLSAGICGILLAPASAAFFTVPVFGSIIEAQPSAPMKSVSLRGFRVLVPASWQVINLQATPTACVRFDRHAVYLGAPGRAEDCPAHLIATKTEALLVEPLSARDAPSGVLTEPVAHQYVITDAPSGVEVTATYGSDQSLIKKILDNSSMRRNGAPVSPSPPAPVAPTPGRPTQAPVTRTALRPALTRAPLTPVVMRAPLRPALTPAPLTPVLMRAPLTPALTRAPLTPALIRTPLTPALTRAPLRPALTPAPLTPALIRTPLTPALTRTPLTPAPTALPHSVTNDTGPGFDACAAPDPATMRAWIRHSPYRAVGIYIGGSDRACAQPNLTAAWVRQQAAAGWRFIPLYVGPQAAWGQITTAASQGMNAADDAVLQARALGFGPGTPLYYDMEAYPRRHSGAAKRFLSAWTDELHADGYASGVYSSSGTGVADLANHYTSYPGYTLYNSSYTTPDVIFDALWNGLADTTDATVPRVDWADHRRIHQYRGGTNQTYGGRRLNIDRDYLDVLLPDYGAPPAWTSAPGSSGAGCCPSLASRSRPWAQPSPHADRTIRSASRTNPRAARPTKRKRPPRSHRRVIQGCARGTSSHRSQRQAHLGHGHSNNRAWPTHCRSH